MADQDSQNAVVDLDRINEFTGGDPEQFKELTDLYLGQASEQIREMHEALQAGERQKLEHLAHKCAGSSATCGMNRIAPLLRELEARARDGELDAAPGLLQQVDQEFSNIRDFLDRHQP